MAGHTRSRAHPWRVVCRLIDGIGRVIQHPTPFPAGPRVLQRCGREHPVGERPQNRRRGLADPHHGIDILSTTTAGPVTLVTTTPSRLPEAFNFAGSTSSSSTRTGASARAGVRASRKGSDFLIGPPRIAILWGRPHPARRHGSWNQKPFSIDVRFENVPDFGKAANSFGLSMITFRSFGVPST